MGNSFSMRKIIIAVIAVLAIAPGLAAQDSPWEIGLDVGTIPFSFIREDEIFYYYSGSNTLVNQYSPRLEDSVITPWLGLKASRHLKGAFSVGAILGFASITNYYIDPMAEDDQFSVRNLEFAVLPYCRMIYQKGKKGNLYGSAGVGVKAVFQQDGNTAMKLSPAYELVPFGLSFGKRIAFNVEMVLGSTVMGFRTGLSYKF